MVTVLLGESFGQDSFGDDDGSTNVTDICAAGILHMLASPRAALARKAGPLCRIHKTLRVTPAMAACVTEKLWEITDMARALEE